MRNVLLKLYTAMIDKNASPQLVSKRLYNAGERFYKISTKLLLMFSEKNWRRFNTIFVGQFCLCNNRSVT